jgi:hypothetical protein
LEQAALATSEEQTGTKQAKNPTTLNFVDVKRRDEEEFSTMDLVSLSHFIEQIGKLSQRSSTALQDAVDLQVALKKNPQWEKWILLNAEVQSMNREEGPRSSADGKAWNVLMAVVEQGLLLQLGHEMDDQLGMKFRSRLDIMPTPQSDKKQPLPLAPRLATYPMDEISDESTSVMREKSEDSKESEWIESVDSILDRFDWMMSRIKE